MTTSVDSSLDSVLEQMGDFGKYQALMFGLICLSVVLHSGVHVAFAFTARDLEYRCEIPECDMPGHIQYDANWVTNAVPLNSDGLSYAKCLRYESALNETIDDKCPAEQFTPRTIRCNQFVYKTNEKTILNEYHLECEENLWKLTLVGTINNVGQFFGLFISGVISDKFGRRLVLVWGLVLCGFCGLARTLAPNYIWFLVFEFLDALFGAGSYVCGFIMGVELVGPKKRVLMGTLASSCYAVGEVLAASSAWLFHSWRVTIYILYGPPMLLIIYLWIIPESIRWNLSKGRIEEAKETLRKVAAFNGKPLAEETLNRLGAVQEKQPAESPAERQTLTDVLRSTPLLLRLINCCFCWITCAFLFYGLQLNSVALAGNPFMDFICSALIEIPAYFACVYVVGKSRKFSMSGSFFITGIACLAFIFVPKASHTGSLVLFLFGKFGATAAFTVTYVVTSEIFPTPLRHSMMGFCSTFGRIGSMIAPQTPLLAQLWDPLPMLMFTGMAVVAGLLSLLFPETLNTQLPDTIEEALEIGKKEIKEKEIKK